MNSCKGYPFLIASVSPSIIVMLWSSLVCLTSATVYWMIPSFCKYLGFCPFFIILLMFARMSYTLGYWFDLYLLLLEQWTIHRDDEFDKHHPAYCPKKQHSFRWFNSQKVIYRSNILQPLPYQQLSCLASRIWAQFSFW